MKKEHDDNHNERRIYDTKHRIGELDDVIQPNIADDRTDDAIGYEQRIVRDLTAQHLAEEIRC